MIETVDDKGEVLAIIVRAGFSGPGIHFFTPHDFSQQLAYMKYPSGKVIEPHLHNQDLREVRLTQEVLFLKSGRMRVDFDDQSNEPLLDGNEKKYLNECVDTGWISSEGPFVAPLMQVNRNLVEVCYEIIVEEKSSNKVETLHESHAMRYLFTPEVESLFCGAGMKPALPCEWMTGREPALDTWGVCFGGVL